MASSIDTHALHEGFPFCYESIDAGERFCDFRRSPTWLFVFVTPLETFAKFVECARSCLAIEQHFFQFRIMCSNQLLLQGEGRV
ncbi:hypothetical protein A8F35_36795 [Burkholderia cenocepacia]|nr:hypothetical protein A8F35_36795 [Burkholderia cenocepacia]ONY92056.1 hypothetical protein A8F34_30270 [Burkholderia cenocepacia]